MNRKFQNALNRVSQDQPPIWFMRQAGRYHKHYQALRAKHDFETLCREPELAAQVALGPIQDFDFDVSILFSDLLFPLDALGMELSYSDKGPKLEHSLMSGFKLPVSFATVPEFVKDKLEKLQFQKAAMELTRKILPANKSLIGFVGGIWTLFTYACEGGHSGSMVGSKALFPQQTLFRHTLLELIKLNIDIQLQGGAEVVMVFDTSVGEVSPGFFRDQLQHNLIELAQLYPKKLGYYSKGTQRTFFSEEFLSAPWAGMGFDHRWDLRDCFGIRERGFVQGNFDQALLFQETSDFKRSLDMYLAELGALSLEEKAGWVCGLGHGVLPKTPEDHVRMFVQRVRGEID